jgi:hypothetical protein
MLGEYWCILFDKVVGDVGGHRARGIGVWGAGVEGESFKIG